MARRREKQLKIVVKKLPRPRYKHRAFSKWVYAFAYIEERLIEIDPRQRPRCFMHTLVHELLHFGFPKASEHQISKAAALITRQLWKMNYRRFDE